MAYRWPTDPKGKPASHSVSWDAHQAALKNPRAKGNEVKIAAPGGGFIPISQWDFNGGGAQPAAPSGGTEGGGKATFDPTAPLPVDPVYDATVDKLGEKRDSTLAGITGARTRGLAEYGFTESGFDPATQTMGALAFDPNNPFSKAALLKSTYDTNRARAGQSMAAGGQLYSGAYQNQQDLLNRNQLQSEDALQKSLAAFLATNTGQRSQAQTDYEMDVIGAKSDRTERALDNPLYSPLIGGPDQGATGPAAAATSPGTTSTTAKKPVAKTPALKNKVLSAGANVRSSKGATATTKRDGKKRTYTTSVKGP